MLQGRAGELRPLPSGKPSRTESLKGRVPFKFACIAFAAPPLADTARQACQATSPRGPSAAVSKLSEGREGMWLVVVGSWSLGSEPPRVVRAEPRRGREHVRRVALAPRGRAKCSLCCIRSM